MLSVNIYTNMLPQKNNGIPGNNFYCIKQRPQRLNLFPTDPIFGVTGLQSSIFS